MNEIQRAFLEGKNARNIATRVDVTEAISFTTITIGPQPDTRYRLLITLQRSDRPRYWNFLCFNCGHKVVELQNLEVYTIDDFYDPQNINNAAIGKHCVGDGKQCPYTYFFKVF